MKILITGGSGIIGSYLSRHFSTEYDVFMIDSHVNKSVSQTPDKHFNIDLLNPRELASFFKTHLFDVIIHCAGASRQVFSNYGYETYRLANVETTRNIAEVAFKANPATHFIFLSSVLVYGEHLKKQPVTEDQHCFPSCDYSKSKYEAENHLKMLSGMNQSTTINILRLVQVYDRTYTDNLDKRVFSPGKLAYIKLGSGHQKMSALSRQNLKKFIGYLIEKEAGNKARTLFNIYNVADKNPYSFMELIKTFKTSAYRPFRPTIPVPLWFIRFFLGTLGFLQKKKKDWLQSCYNKLSLDFIYDNTKMLKIGFVPEDNLSSVFLDQTPKTPEIR